MIRSDKIFAVILFFMAKSLFSQDILSDICLVERPKKILVFYEPFSIFTIIPYSAMDVIWSNELYYETYEKEPFVFYKSLIEIINNSEQLEKIEFLNIETMEVLEKEVTLSYVNARLVIVFIGRGNREIEIFGFGQTGGTFSYEDKVYVINFQIINIIYDFLVDNNLEKIEQDFYKIFSDKYEL
jgi:hypothetical protein